MTKPRYPQGCSAGSQVCGRAESPSDYAWIVNFNNGNSNWNNRNNNAFVRAVRPSECHGVTFADLYAAWRQARHKKRPSENQLQFESDPVAHLLEIEAEIRAGTWRPRPTTCFIADHPKAREIHAPDFADRVVHHWLVPQLERIYENTFIFDSFSNRVGKGTHAAVSRLQGFARQVESGQGGGYYLQLDIKNFFNSIHRPTLYRMLKIRMQRSAASVELQRVVHSLLRYSPSEVGVHYACTLAERERVPPHKRLANAAPGCGIPIGNLSSQFFANVYLDALDQFVKHELKIERYVRYVDDFVIVHRSREQLLQWQTRIVEFLAKTLKLELKSDVRLNDLSSGVDFLGYIVYSTRLLVRPRVLQHCIAKLEAFQLRHIGSTWIRATPQTFHGIQSIYASYLGHFKFARHHRLQQRLRDRFPWLASIETRRTFALELDRRVVRIRRCAA